MNSKKTGFLITSHGPLAFSILETVEMILGKQNEKKVFFLSLEKEDDLRSYEEKFKKKLEQIFETNEKLYILTDVVGGTPNNTAIKYMINNKKIEVVSGFNLPLVLEILENLDDDINLDEIIKNSKESLKEMKIINEIENEGEEWL